MRSETKFINSYVKFLKRFLVPRRKLKAVFDCSNGTTGIILKELFGNSKIKAIILNSRPDGDFPAHGPNPMAKGATKQLEREVKKQKADLGVIFDADGDRVFFVDDKGRPIDPNEAGYMLMQRHVPPYVVGVTSSWRLKKHPKVSLSKVGHYFFKKLMRKRKANLGLEHSGHYYFKKFFYSDSGILAAIEVINFVSGFESGVAEWLDALPKYYRSGEINFEARDKKSSIKKIENYYRSRAKRISKLDGLTMEFDEWWFNLRPSNTENLLRLNAESLNKDKLEKVLKELRGSVKA
jgi:phosphomannomutase